MAKRTIQATNVNFRVGVDLKTKCEIALEKESKGLSEFLRDAMYRKVSEYESKHGEILLD